jgi:hypothetical protein
MGVILWGESGPQQSTFALMNTSIMNNVFNANGQSKNSPNAGTVPPHET